MSAHLKIDVAFHVQVCLQFFMNVKNSSSKPSLDIQSSVSNIYQAATGVLEGVLKSSSAAGKTQHKRSSSIDESVVSDHSDVTSVESEDSYFHNSSTTFDYLHKENASLALIEDLLLITTFACSSASNSLSPFIDKAKRPVSIKSVLISLSLYWGVAALTTQNLSPSTRNTLLASIQCLMSKAITYNAAATISEDIANHLFLTSKDISPSARFLCMKLKAAVRSCLKTPLLFGVVLGLAMHSDISRRFPDNFAVCNSYDRNSLAVVAFLSKCNPRAGLVCEDATGCTPISIAAAYRSVKSQASAHNFSLSLMQLLSQQCPSAMAIADKAGLYPLHHAARDGETDVMLFIAQCFPYTAPLKDLCSLYALNYALDSAYRHSEEALLALAKVFPTAVQHCPTVLLSLEEKNVISASLGRSLMELCKRVSPVVIQSEEVATPSRDSAKRAKHATPINSSSGSSSGPVSSSSKYNLSNLTCTSADLFRCVSDDAGSDEAGSIFSAVDSLLLLCHSSGGEESPCRGMLGCESDSEASLSCANQALMGLNKRKFVE